jgi:hypothetical protein
MNGNFLLLRNIVTLVLPGTLAPMYQELVPGKSVISQRLVTYYGKGMLTRLVRERDKTCMFSPLVFRSSGSVDSGFVLSAYAQYT